MKRPICGIPNVGCVMWPQVRRARTGIPEQMARSEPPFPNCCLAGLPSFLVLCLCPPGLQWRQQRGSLRFRFRFRFRFLLSV